MIKLDEHHISGIKQFSDMSDNEMEKMKDLEKVYENFGNLDVE